MRIDRNKLTKFDLKFLIKIVEESLIERENGAYIECLYEPEEIREAQDLLERMKKQYKE